MLKQAVIEALIAYILENGNPHKDNLFLQYELDGQTKDHRFRDATSYFLRKVDGIDRLHQTCNKDGKTTEKIVVPSEPPKDDNQAMLSLMGKFVTDFVISKDGRTSHTHVEDWVLDRVVMSKAGFKRYIGSAKRGLFPELEKKARKECSLKQELKRMKKDVAEHAKHLDYQQGQIDEEKFDKFKEAVGAGVRDLEDHVEKCLGKLSERLDDVENKMAA